MLGMSVGSLFVYFKPDLFPRERLFDNLVWISAAFAISVVLSSLSLITTLAPTGIANTLAMTVVVWLKMIIILLPPYIFAGMAVSLALTRSPWPVGLVYGVDLLGAASGCLIALVLLTWADSISALIAIAAFASVGSVSFSMARHRSGEIGPSLAVVGWLGRGRRPVILSVVFGLVAIGNAAIQPTAETGWLRGGLVLLHAKNALELSPPAITRWNSYSRVTASQSYVGPPGLWGPSPITPVQAVPERHLSLDGGETGVIDQFDGDLSKLDFLRYDNQPCLYNPSPRP